MTTKNTNKTQVIKIEDHASILALYKSLRQTMATTTSLVDEMTTELKVLESSVDTLDKSIRNTIDDGKSKYERTWLDISKKLEIELNLKKEFKHGFGLEINHNDKTIIVTNQSSSMLRAIEEAQDLTPRQKETLLSIIPMALELNFEPLDVLITRFVSGLNNTAVFGIDDTTGKQTKINSKGEAMTFEDFFRSLETMQAIIKGKIEELELKEKSKTPSKENATPLSLVNTDKDNLH